MKKPDPLVEPKKTNWLVWGTLYFGGFMWVSRWMIDYILGVAWPWTIYVFVGVPVYLLSGFLVGCLGLLIERSVKCWMRKKGRSQPL